MTVLTVIVVYSRLLVVLGILKSPNTIVRPSTTITLLISAFSERIGVWFVKWVVNGVMTNLLTTRLTIVFYGIRDLPVLNRKFVDVNIVMENLVVSIAFIIPCGVRPAKATSDGAVIGF